MNTCARKTQMMWNEKYSLAEPQRSLSRSLAKSLIEVVISIRVVKLDTADLA